MKRIPSSIVMILMVLCTISCSKERIPDSGNQPQARTFNFTLAATLPDLEDTRATVVTVARLNWEAGDKISVINLTTNKALGGDLSANASGTSTSFSGTLTGTVSTGDVLAFLYPSQGYTAETDFSSVSLDFSAQNGTVSDKLAVYALYTAPSSTITTASAKFKYLMSYMKINMADLPASKAITQINITNVNTMLTLTNTGSDFAAAGSGASTNVIVTPASTKTVSSAGTANVSIAVPVAASLTTRKILVHFADNLYYSTSLTSAELSSGALYNTSPAAFDRICYVPDAQFKSYLLTNFDSNADGEISATEAAAVTSIECQEMGIVSMIGIKDFVNLTYLRCAGNSITALDLTGLTALTTLRCEDNQLAHLYVNNCTKLNQLWCGNNKLTYIDVWDNTALQGLYIYQNDISEINLLQNTALTTFNATRTSLTALDASANVNLTNIRVSRCRLQTIQLPAVSTMTFLECDNNRLSGIDISKCTGLTSVYCAGQTTDGTTSSNVTVYANATQLANWSSIGKNTDSTVSCVLSSF